MRILNGRLGDPKNTGRYTCHTHNGQSVVDHIISDAHGAGLINSLSVQDTTQESDHSDIKFPLSSQRPNPIATQSMPQAVKSQSYQSFKFNASKADHYKQALEGQPCRELQELIHAEVINENQSIDNTQCCF